MTTKAEIDKVIERWGNVPRHLLPPLLRGNAPAGTPLTGHEFALALALVLHQTAEGKAGPTYDENNTLIGWFGIRPRDVP
jgi:hypothetical protein